MVKPEEGYAILTNICLPVDLLLELAKQGFSVEYEYEHGDYKYRPASSVSSVKLISGEELIANQVAYRMKKEK